MDDSDEFVRLFTGRSRLEADLVRGLLEGEGFVVYQPGSQLQDEWASWGQAAGMIGTELWVARGDLERAREVLASVREAEPPSGDEEDPPLGDEE